MNEPQAELNPDDPKQFIRAAIILHAKRNADPVAASLAALVWGYAALGADVTLDDLQNGLNLARRDLEAAQRAARSGAN